MSQSVAALQKLAADADSLQSFFLAYADTLDSAAFELPNLKKRQRDLKLEIANYEGTFRLEVSIAAKTPEGVKQGLGNEKARDAEVLRLMKQDRAASMAIVALEATEEEIRKLETVVDHLEEDFKARQSALTAVTHQIQAHIAILNHLTALKEITQ